VSGHHHHEHGHAHDLTDTVPEVRRVLIVTLVLNELVAMAKIFFGYITGSIGMVSDGFHSLFDGISNIVGLIGIWLASRPPDEQHPYGHKKYETLFTIVISVMILGTCLQILRRVFHSFTEGNVTEVSTASFIVMAATISVNIFVMLYEGRMGKKLGSDFLVADALHTKSDILTSVAVVIGLIFTRLGYPLGDTAAALIITFFIARIGFQIIKNASDVLVDTTLLDPEAINDVVCSVKGVKGCHGVRTRGLKRHIYMDLHILVDPEMTTQDAHDLALEVEHRIHHEFEDVDDIVVHIEPAPEGTGKEEMPPNICPHDGEEHTH